MVRAPGAPWDHMVERQVSVAPAPHAFAAVPVVDPLAHAAAYPAAPAPRVPSPLATAGAFPAVAGAPVVAVAARGAGTDGNRGTGVLASRTVLATFHFTVLLQLGRWQRWGSYSDSPGKSRISLSLFHASTTPL
jgi:hypothetical protein